MIETDIENLKDRVKTMETILSGLLSLAYRDEFVVVDRLLQHPMGYSFRDWLINKHPEISELWRYE